MAEKAGAAADRDELLAGLSGRVIEVGAGSGLCFNHYPDTVTEVVAVEPQPYLRHLAERAAATAAVPIRVVEGSADNLPAEAATFDAAVASLVLCTVPDQKSHSTSYAECSAHMVSFVSMSTSGSENPRQAWVQDRGGLVLAARGRWMSCKPRYPGGDRRGWFSDRVLSSF